MSEQRVRLLADGMLGRLARWLRMLGYDTLYESDADDLALARSARAEGRVLLTRDRALAARRGLQTLFIESEELSEQIAQVQENLGDPLDPPLSRCSLCNTPLMPLSQEEAASRVPPYVLRTSASFVACPDCGRTYWDGTHVQHMRRQMEDLGGE